MGQLLEITYEYLDSLRYVNEIRREIVLPTASPDVVAIVGPRRSGKTFLMLKTANDMLKNNKQVIYVSFDEPSLRKIPVRRFAELVRKEYPEGKINLFLDEIQEWKDWDFHLRWLHDVKDFNIFISGSSSSLQSSEIPSRLRGRYTSKLVTPFSFREVCNFSLKTFRERGRVQNVFEEYVKWGGFPEVWIYKSREKIVSLLETIFYRDLVERFRIRNIVEFQSIFYFVLSNYSNSFTWNSLKKFMEKLDVKVDTKTLINYVNYMSQAFLIFTLQKFSYSEREKAVSPKKIYVIDLAFSNLFEKPLDLGRKMENLVFIELLRRLQNRTSQVFYHTTKDGKEIDFIIKTGGRIEQMIEVCYEVDEEHVKKVVKAGEELKCKKLLCITRDQEGEISVKNMKIEYVPIWKWLLRV
ncbi:MAG: ATP-binding protein [Candidatus Brockarchaeota archaeon]|nr:ATP-binding protein [Candidatus Brockarchaeota archaeon]